MRGRLLRARRKRRHGHSNDLLQPSTETEIESETWSCRRFQELSTAERTHATLSIFLEPGRALRVRSCPINGTLARRRDSGRHGDERVLTAAALARPCRMRARAPLKQAALLASAKRLSRNADPGPPRNGTATVSEGPGSAAHRSASLHAALRPGHESGGAPPRHSPFDC